jgi:hypothetical protein
MTYKIAPRRATSLPPHGRQIDHLPLLSVQGMTPTADDGNKSLKNVDIVLTPITGHTAVTTTKDDYPEDDVCASSIEPQDDISEHITHVHSSPLASSVTSSTSKAKGRKRIDDANDMSPEEFQSVLNKMKAEVIAKGGKVFTCEHFGGSGVCHTLQVNTVDQRLCVSDYFGRNKSKTRGIKRPITWCRKHYQRFSYQAKSWQATKLFLINQQLDRIEEDDPGTIYNISLKKSEEKRLSEANNNKAGGNTTNTKNAKKDEAPIAALQYIYDNFLGNNKAKEVCKEFVTWCGEELKKGTFENIPRVEMVPQFMDQVEDQQELESSEDEEMTDATPTQNAVVKKTSRISQKGAIQKP